MLFRVFLFFLVFLIIEVNAQNLVPNPSFETGAWVQANGGSADYLNASNVFGNQTTWDLHLETRDKADSENI